MGLGSTARIGWAAVAKAQIEPSWKAGNWWRFAGCWGSRGIAIRMPSIIGHGMSVAWPASAVLGIHPAGTSARSAIAQIATIATAVLR